MSKPRGQVINLQREGQLARVPLRHRLAGFRDSYGKNPVVWLYGNEARVHKPELPQRRRKLGKEPSGDSAFAAPVTAPSTAQATGL